MCETYNATYSKYPCNFSVQEVFRYAWRHVRAAGRYYFVLVLALKSTHVLRVYLEWK
jgi:hypothetical protein